MKNMTTTIDLKKKTAKLVLEKRGVVTPPPAEVGITIDVSGSMRDEFARGEVQQIMERALAVATHFDKDGKMDVWTFDTNANYIGTADETQAPNFVQQKIINNNSISKWGGTCYAPVMNLIESHYFNKQVVSSGGLMGFFGKKTVTETKPDAPVFIMHITDGENNDHYEFEEKLKQWASKNLYVQIVGIGNGDLSYVQEVAASAPNVGFCQIRDLKCSDEQMMEQMIQPEFIQWVKQF